MDYDLLTLDNVNDCEVIAPKFIGGTFIHHWKTSVFVLKMMSSSPLDIDNTCEQ